MYNILSEVCLEEEEEYQNYLRPTPECFDKLFVVLIRDITKNLTNMRDAITPKLKLDAKIFHVHSFTVLYFLIFLMCRFKILTGCILSN